MSQTSDIDWKRIEIKPDNWETVQALIGSAMHVLPSSTPAAQGKSNAPEESSGFVFDASFVLDHLLTHRWADTRASHVWRITSECLQELKKTNGAKTTASTKGKKRTGGGSGDLKKADAIRLKNAQRMIIKDLEKIHFEGGRPTVFLYQYDLTFAVMILEWWIVLETAHAGVGLWTEALVAADRFFRRKVDTSSTPLAGWLKRVHERIVPLVRTEAHLRHLFQNPKLMMYSVAERYPGSAMLYETQKDLIRRVGQAVICDTPLLIGNRMPPGTGKTFLAVPLAQALQPLHRPKTVLFCCPNILVRQYVASLALIGHDLHLWMGCFTRSSANEEFFMIRPHKRCFPSIWKQVYKEDTGAKYGDVYDQIDYYRTKTERLPDILVCDPKTCLALLSNERRRDTFVAYIDEIIGSTDTTQLMTKILYHLPQHSVIMSAILPHFDDLPFLTSHFASMHPNPVCHMVDASGVTISCSMIGPDGRLNLPHHYIDGIESIPNLVRSLQSDPLTRRMYAPADVLELSRILLRVHPERYDSLCQWTVQLPALGKIEYAYILDWWIRMLGTIYTHQDQPAWDAVRFYKPTVLQEPPVFDRMFAEHAWMFPGKHLHIMDNARIHQRYRHLGRRHLDGCPDIQSLRRKRDASVAQLKIQRDKIQELKIARGEKERMLSEWSDQLAALDRLEWPSEYVLNTTSHYRRFHTGGGSTLPLGIGMRHPILIDKEHEDAFEQQFLEMAVSGSVLYEERQLTEHQRRIILRIMDKMNFIVSGDELVFGTNIDGLTGLSIETDFGERHHRSILYQLIGRTGRTGMSYQARVIVDSPTVLAKIMTPEVFAEAGDDPDIRALREAWPTP